MFALLLLARTSQYWRPRAAVRPRCLGTLGSSEPSEVSTPTAVRLFWTRRIAMSSLPSAPFGNRLLQALPAYERVALSANLRPTKSAHEDGALRAGRDHRGGSLSARPGAM